MLRSKINPQVELDFTPSNLKLTQKYYAKYEEISRTLEENPEILEVFHRDLKKALKYSSAKGNNGSPFKFTTDTVVRILLVMVIEGESLRGTVIRIDDSQFLRRFVRIYDGPMTDYTTLCKLKNVIRPQTWKKANRLLTKYAFEQEYIDGEILRLDTTAVETNVHYPTDSWLLWDCYRVFGRLIRQALSASRPCQIQFSIKPSEGSLAENQFRMLKRSSAFSNLTPSC